MEQYKAAPLGFTAADVADLPSARPLLRDFPTPLVTLSESAVAHNLATMAAWCREAGVGIAPHGKTTMSRELWNRQLDAGAWGVTVATPWQASVALGWGVPRVLLANALVQPAALRALAADADRLTVWADSTRAVEIMTESLSGAEAPVPLDVLVELGGAGGRTGARGVEAALAVASAVAASPSLRLAGVAGYEGALAHDASPESLARVGDYLAELLELHDAIEAAGLYSPDDAVILTAGGSAYFDQVADAGYYRSITPLRRTESGREFRAAIHGWATVVSHPEPGLVLVDAGKRDLPYDEGLPVPQAIRRLGTGVAVPLEGAVTTALNDQHAFVRVPDDAVVEVGDVIRFGLSHPCTTFDKWRALAVVDDALAHEPRVIGLLDTAFG